MSKDATKKKAVLFWLQIVSILCAGVALSILVYSMRPATSTTEEAVTRAEYTVTFAQQDGTIIAQKPVKEGSGTFPPKVKTEHVFRGWSKGFNSVKADIEVHPMIYTIVDENLFYFNSIYVQEGTDFILDIMLGGTVSISAAELTVTYDPEVMEYIDAENGNVCGVTMTEPGVLKIQLNSETKITEKTMITQIAFYAKEKDVYSTEIKLSCKNAHLVEAGAETPVTATTINNKIYYLQEVS